MKRGTLGVRGRRLQGRRRWLTGLRRGVPGLALRLARLLLRLGGCVPPLAASQAAVARLTAPMAFLLCENSQ